MKKQLNPAAIALILVAVIGAILGVLWTMSEAPKGKAEDFKGMPAMGGGGAPSTTQGKANPTSGGAGKPEASKSAPTGKAPAPPP